MIRIMVYFSFGLVLLMLQSSPVTSDIPRLNICQYGMLTAPSVTLNMDTYRIAGTTSPCQCKIKSNMYLTFYMSFQGITSPDCGTNIILSDGSFQHTCQDSIIPNITYEKNFQPREVLTLQAKAKTATDQSMTGSIQMKTYNDTDFTLECIERKVTRSPTTSKVTTTSQVTSITTTTTLQTGSFGSRPSTASSVSTPASSLLPTQPTTAGATYVITTQSNETLLDPKNFPVALTAGCAAGGVVLVGLIIVAIVICRRKGKYPQGNSKKHDPTSIQKADRRSMGDEYISMENDLYCSSDDLPMPSENTTSSDRTDVEPEEKKKQVVSPNGDIYTIVDKPKNISSPPKSKLNHRTAPSGDVYTVVDKLR